MMRMASDHDEEHDEGDLGDEELGDPLGEPTLLRRENHLQHVAWIETLVIFRIFSSEGLRIIKRIRIIRINDRDNR